MQSYAEVPHVTEQGTALASQCMSIPIDGLVVAAELSAIPQRLYSII
jgi:hypothetical protein